MIMNFIDNYNDTRYELNILKERFKIISKYEEQLKLEKNNLVTLIKLQENILYEMENNLKNLNGIESRLYTEIAINGMKVTKAIEKVAIENNKDVSTLWKNYYPNVKSKIDELYFKVSNRD